jgi:hypothetical protein
MRYKYNHKYRRNWGSMIELAIGIFAWAFMCGLMWWALLKMLEVYTTN